MLSKKVRVINAKFHIDNESNIRKTSSDEIIPLDEPLFLIRGRDKFAVTMLHYYALLCLNDKCTSYQMEDIGKCIISFEEYASDDRRMKQPGVTRGMPWTPLNERLPFSTSKKSLK